MRLAISARPEQNHSQAAVFKANLTIEACHPIDIINCALRDAALAPTANDALDCCADVLLVLAELARAEVRHD